jgi:hypothetical protein
MIDAHDGRETRSASGRSLLPPDGLHAAMSKITAGIFGVLQMLGIAGSRASRVASISP